LAFIGAVFAMYLVYGLLLIKFYQEIQQLKDVGDGIYRGLSVAAIVFGALNIRDFVRYKPGGIGTEMPLFMRPRVKKIINNITSTKGAFVTGLIVSFFLLPCTIGPYIIASKIMADVPLAKGVPMLLLYNLIFIIPLTIIVSSVYLGTSRIHDFYLWKERNISKLHLIAGIILLGLGIFMLLESLGIVVFWGIA
jgi:cytochrome c biogenesis protein CcdA